MSGLVSWVTANWEGIASALALLVLVGERVVAMTPSQEDDRVVASIHRALSKIFTAVGLKFPEK